MVRLPEVGHRVTIRINGADYRNSSMESPKIQIQHSATTFLLDRDKDAEGQQSALIITKNRYRLRKSFASACSQKSVETLNILVRTACLLSLFDCGQHSLRTLPAERRGQETRRLFGSSARGRKCRDSDIGSCFVGEFQSAEPPALNVSEPGRCAF